MNTEKDKSQKNGSILKKLLFDYLQTWNSKKAC